MTEDEYHDHVSESDGLCLACGKIQYGGVEPDAIGYDCEACLKNKVVGIEHALVNGDIEIAW